MAEKTNQIKFDYDEDADVLYVTLGSGEPSFSQDVDDHVVIDFGMYTGAPTGFQILHMAEADVHAVQVRLMKELTELSVLGKEEMKKMVSQRQQTLKKAIQSFPSRIGDLVSK
jgi:uncharacterized protein YuzE